MLKENNFLAGHKIVYKMASFVSLEIEIALLSCFPHAVHLNPLSLKLKQLKSLFPLQHTQFCTLGVNPNMQSSLILKIAVTREIGYSDSDNVYKVFKNNCNIL